jgi:hypothetical protein
VFHATHDLLSMYFFYIKKMDVQWFTPFKKKKNNGLDRCLKPHMCRLCCNRPNHTGPLKHVCLGLFFCHLVFLSFIFLISSFNVVFLLNLIL